MSREDVPGAGSVDPKDHPPIAFADEDWQWFIDRLQALELSAHCPERQLVEALYGHLVGVNRWLNLTRITEARPYLKFHWLDSLTLMADRRLRKLKHGPTVMDLGSGGGFPGIPLALCCQEQPWVLVDSRQRKVTFLQAAIELAGLQHVTARHFRAREVAKAAPDLRRSCQLIVSRAAGPMDKLLIECQDILLPHGHLLISKGPATDPEERQRALQQAERLYYHLRHEATVQLEDDDPQRHFFIWERM